MNSGFPDGSFLVSNFLDSIAPLGSQQVMKQMALYSAAFADLVFKNASSDLVS
jgi:hypothetical protein